MSPGAVPSDAVCFRCRDPRIRPQTTGDGLWPGGGEGVAWVCSACGHIGAPFLEDHAGPAHATGGPSTGAIAEDDGGDGPVPAAWAAEFEAAARDVEAPRAALPWKRPRRGLAIGLALVSIPFLALLAFVVWNAAWLGGATLALAAAVTASWLGAVVLALWAVGRRVARPDPAPSKAPEPPSLDS